jgi:hypothetical protein
MSVAATFFVSLGSTGPGFFYPAGRAGFLAVAPPPAFIGDSISVVASVVDTDAALDAMLTYDQADVKVSPSLPADWSPDQRTLNNNSERWSFRPTAAALHGENRSAPGRPKTGSRHTVWFASA